MLGPIYLLLAAALCSSAAAHAVPRQTDMPTPTTTTHAPSLTINLQSWLLAETAPPALLGDLALEPRRGRRQNTVCGYIGGDPDLPATCAAGSHCAVDVEHGAIGCCPNDGGCDTGIFTSCVDFNSDPQTVADPYVYTCAGKNVCYKNTFDGGFFQYGCGTASDLATSVATKAAGKKPLALTSMSMDLTATPTLLTTPTTISSHHVSSSSFSSSSAGSSSASSDSASSSSTSSSSSAGSSSSANSETSGDAPSAKGSSKHTGAVVGGSIGGFAALLVLMALALWLWRRKKGNSRQGPGRNQDIKYMSPMTENRRDFEPLSSSSNEFNDVQTPPLSAGYNDSRHNVPKEVPLSLPRQPDLTRIPEDSNAYHGGAEPFRPNYPYGYGPGSTAGGVTAVRGDSPTLESDRVPLTREFINFSDNNDTAAVSSQEENERDDSDTNPLGSYPGRRRGGGGSFWQQNRRHDRNMMWM